MRGSARWGTGASGLSRTAARAVGLRPEKEKVCDGDSVPVDGGVELGPFIPIHSFVRELTDRVFLNTFFELHSQEPKKALNGKPI